MASNPPVAQDPALLAGDPAEGAPADAAEDDMSQGYCIEISVLPDDTFTVDVEPLAQEAAEENASGEQPEAPSAPIKDFGAALKKALMIFQNQGQDVDEEAAFADGMSSSSKPTPKSMNY